MRIDLAADRDNHLDINPGATFSFKLIDGIGGMKPGYINFMGLVYKVYPEVSLKETSGLYLTHNTTLMEQERLWLTGTDGTTKELAETTFFPFDSKINASTVIFESFHQAAAKGAEERKLENEITLKKASILLEKVKIHTKAEELKSKSSAESSKADATIKKSTVDRDTATAKGLISLAALSVAAIKLIGSK